ncbi:MAG: RsmD family RNA methyltransferase [Crocinitomicaceae bacterium]|nr:RsmD family RNA methyltransferase [Crocinitomicaceae bacterium]
MRIIRGKFKSRWHAVPKGFPSRPTTDFAKEGLFNILEHNYGLHDLNILDLCAGTGNISIEFISRESGKVIAVDKNYNCVKFIKSMVNKYDCADDIVVIKAEILKYLTQSTQQFDIIFADPPYAYEHHKSIAELVFERNLLTPNGVLIIEHGKETNLEDITHFSFSRIYGKVHFSFFEIENNNE